MSKINYFALFNLLFLRLGMHLEFQSDVYRRTFARPFGGKVNSFPMAT